MNINSNNNLHFGMAYRMKGDAAKRVAEYCQEMVNPKEAEEYFIKMANELKKLTTEVIAEGGDVRVVDPITKQVYKMTDSPAWRVGDSGRVIKYPVEAEAHCGTQPAKVNIDVAYSEDQSKICSPAWEANFVYDGLFRKHIHALEVAKEFDRQAAIDAANRAAELAKAESITSRAEKLTELFG